MDDVLRLKLKLKSWEQQFEQLNHRKPTKQDIRKHPRVAEQYKRYEKLKNDDSMPSSDNDEALDNHIIEPSPIKPKRTFLCKNLSKFKNEHEPTKGTFGTLFNKMAKELPVEKDESAFFLSLKEETDKSVQRTLSSLQKTASAPVPQPTAKAKALSHVENALNRLNRYNLWIHCDRIKQPSSTIANVKTVAPSSCIQTLKIQSKPLEMNEAYQDSEPEDEDKEEEKEPEIKKRPKKARKRPNYAGKRVGGPAPKKWKRGKMLPQQGRYSYSYSLSASDIIKQALENPYHIKEEDGMPLVQKNRSKTVDYKAFILNAPTETSFSFEMDSNSIHVDLKAALYHVFGFNEFKDGQEDIVRRVLLGESCFLATCVGSGKSLTYQLSTAILKAAHQHIGGVGGVTLVISPTLSLMNDQLHHLPHYLKGDAFTSGHLMDDLFQSVENGEVDVLFMTPERLGSEAFQTFIKQKRMPKVWFTCIDEIHCTTYLSDQFRAPYLLLGHWLKDFNSPILGLSATLRKALVPHVCDLFDISHVTWSLSIPKNIQLSVIKLEDNDEREQLIVDMFQSIHFQSLKSIIIYTLYQNQADRLAAMLRISNIHAESYHSGKPIKERQRIAQEFQIGQIRVIVGTISFGLGIDHRQVSSVIHYSLPKNIEHYVQDIGRAGRNGETAYCRLFLSSKDYIQQRSFAFSDGVDRFTVRQFLKHIFSAPTTESHRVILKKDETQAAYDMTDSAISTLLLLLQQKYSSLKCQLGTFTKYFVYLLKSDSNNQQHPLTSAILKRGTVVKGKNGYEIQVFDLCQELSCQVQDIVNQLYQSKFRKEIYFEAMDLAYTVDIDPSYWSIWKESNEEIIEELTEQLKDMENSRASKLDQLYHVLNIHSEPVSQLQDWNPSTLLQEAVLQYFENPDLEQSLPKIADPDLLELAKEWRTTAQIDIKLFIKEFKQDIDSGRTVARIFHGISSPKYPASQWSKEKYWGQYNHIEFSDICRWASKALADSV